MKRCLLIPALCCALLLSGCSSLLDRPYVMVEPHVEQPVVAGDSSIIQVSTYSELVNAVLFLVSQGTEEGMIQLTDYRGEVEDDLNRACLEVATDDPLAPTQWTLSKTATPGYLPPMRLSSPSLTAAPRSRCRIS